MASKPICVCLWHSQIHSMQFDSLYASACVCLVQIPNNCSSEGLLEILVKPQGPVILMQLKSHIRMKAPSYIIFQSLVVWLRSWEVKGKQIRELMEEFREKRKDLCLIFIYLHLAYDRVLRQLKWRIVKRKCIPNRCIETILHSGHSLKTAYWSVKWTSSAVSIQKTLLITWMHHLHFYMDLNDWEINKYKRHMTHTPVPSFVE